MAVFAWTPEFSVRNAELDGHHQKLFDLVNRLQAAMAAGQGKRSLDATLAELIEYTANHFAAEERLMAAVNYPALAEHKAQHESLTAKVLAFKRDYDAGRATVTMQLLQFLRQWLQSHILQTDREYAPFIGDEAGCAQPAEPSRA